MVLVREELECAEVDIWSIQDVFAVYTKCSIERRTNIAAVPLRLC
jgi:hypothetical protein